MATFPQQSVELGLFQLHDSPGLLGHGTILLTAWKTVAVVVSKHSSSSIGACVRYKHTLGI